MQKTNIQYLTHTWNPIAMKCTPVSEGCRNCWHLKITDRMCKNMALPEGERLALEGTGPFVLRTREMDAPLRLKKPGRIGVQFMGDLFHEDMPADFIKSVWEVMSKCPHIFLILTKRAKRLPDIAHWLYRQEAKNVWLGVTVCNQDEADEKIPILLQIPAVVRWVSLEPLLEPVDLQYAAFNGADSLSALEGISWVVLGGETGPGARPMKPEWAIAVKDQCQAQGVPFFFKNLGKETSRMLEGREWNELPS